MPASGLSSPGVSALSAKEAGWLETVLKGQLRASVSLCVLAQPLSPSCVSQPCKVLCSGLL